MTEHPRHAHGFELLRQQPLPEYAALARLYRHTRSGAELLSLSSADENKVFGITFRTPPPDSTGVAHILEHSVLCGSRKYPVKAPFVELMKGSLATFLNAMTFADRTSYPVASQNLRDFYNLVDVYLDAVFYPRISPRTLQQEGWHLELASGAAPLAYKGVVYNEMKGNYASPEYLLSELSQRSLFPDTAYGEDAGGDPEHIPDLCFAEFKSFHERCYHPSNALLYFHGDDDPEMRLRYLDGWLSQFTTVAGVDLVPALQPRFGEPRRVTSTFPAGRLGGIRAGLVTVNWMLEEVAAPEQGLALAILDWILMGTPAAPLRKALIDSGLGADVAGAGLDRNTRQWTFSVGLKGIDPEDAGKLEDLVLATLRRLAESGIERDTVEAAVNTVEFRLRENNSGGFPQGLALMLRAASAWTYRRDPIGPLAFAAPLAALKHSLAAGCRLFEDLIDAQLLGNPHRTTLILRPDPALAERRAAELDERLARIRAGMSSAEVAAAVETTRALAQLQAAPDPPAALASIPSLAPGDLPRRNRSLPLEARTLGGARVLYHELPTGGLVYVDVGLDLRPLPADLVPYAALLGRALLESGTRALDPVRLTERIGRLTGGIRPQRWASAMLGSERATAWLFLRGKCIAERAGELTGILRDILLEARLDNRERVRQLVLEEKAAMEARLLPMGSQFAGLRLRSSLHEADWANEQMAGIAYLLFLRGLAERLDRDEGALNSALEDMRRTLLDRAAMLVNVTAEPAGWSHLEPGLTELVRSLPSDAGPAPAAAGGWPPLEMRPGEGLTVPSQVNYVAKGANLHRFGAVPAGTAAVARSWLGTSWLWDKVRVQGGAYGGSCSFDRLSGCFTFLSYRDPNLMATLDIFDQSGEVLAEAEIATRELGRTIVGTVGDLDRHLLADAKGFTSMQRWLTGDTDEARQALREEVLAVTRGDLHRFAALLSEVARQGRVVVLGSDQAIAAANALRPGLLAVSRLL